MPEHRAAHRRGDSSPKSHRLWRFSRDGTLFAVGLAGIIYETLVTGADRPQLLLLFAAMVGLPAFLRGDEQMSRKDD